MTDNFEGWRVTALMRPKYSLGHNLRLPDYVETQKHIDPTRPHGIVFHMGDERETFNKIFEDAIKEYNNGKRKDRQIKDYYQKVLDDERCGKHKNPKANSKRQPFYEFQYYIGRRESHCPDEKAKKVLNIYLTKIFPKRFPNFIITSLAWHNDEYSFNRKGERFESPLHFHAPGIFVAHALTPEELKEEMEYRRKCKEIKKAELEAKGIAWDEEKWKGKDWRKGMIERWGKALERGMSLQTSMSAACNEMGFFTEKGKGTAQQQFEEAVRHDLMDFCEEMGIKINRTKGHKHSHQSKEDYVYEQNNIEWDAELKEKQKVLEAKEIALANQIDDFDYRIEHLEEKEQELEKTKKNLKQQEEQLKNDSDKITEREQQLESDKIKLGLKEKQLDSKQKLQLEKETYLSNKEEYLKKLKTQLDEQDSKQSEREKRIQQGEAPLLKKEMELSDREDSITQRELSLQIDENKIKNREKLADEKLESANKKETHAVETLNQAQKEKSDAVNAQNQMQQLLDENQKQIDIFNLENRSKITEIENWKEASEQIKDSDSWIKTSFEEYNSNRHKPNAIVELYNKVKKGITAVITKVKQAYDKKLDELNERLFGHKRFYSEGRNIVCEYNYGESDFADMLRDTPVDNIQKAIDETKKLGKKTFSEVANTKENKFEFYERYFDKAKTLTRERMLELERRRERAITR